MTTVRRTSAMLGAVTSAAALALALGVPARGAAIIGWRVVFSHHYGAPANQSLYTAVVATGQRDAWAFGVDNWVNPGSGRPVAEHWNGSTWRRSALPPGLHSSIYAASASSANNVWAAPEFGGEILRWNGSTWSVAKKLSGPYALTGVKAFSADDVWVSGGGSSAFPGFGTWHFDGRTWTKVTGIGAGVSSLSAVSPANIWGIASIKNPDDAILHYNGTAWRHVTAPVLTGFGPQMILAESASDVWVTGTPETNGRVWRILHFDNGTWTSVPLPWPTTGLAWLASDGHDGFWLEAYTHHGTWTWHRSASGQWSRTQVYPGVMALIPGTTSLLGAGGTPAKPDYATIWAYGPFG